MQTKSGLNIPSGLSVKIQNTRALKNAWDKLRPSCQTDYVNRVKKAGNAETRKIKIEKVIQLTKNYAEKHPDKYKKPGPSLNQPLY